MASTEWLALAGMALAALLFLLSVPQTSELFGIILLGLSVFALVVTNVFYRLSKLPPFTILSNESRISILDTDGRAARFRKAVLLRANHSKLITYAHRNISADGAIHGFLLNPEVSLMNEHHSAGDYSIHVKFPKPLRRFERTSTWLEFELQNAFLADTESATLIIDQPTKAARIDVEFPAERRPTVAKATYRYSGIEEELAPPEIFGSTLRWTKIHRFSSLPYGEYEISWVW